MDLKVTNPLLKFNLRHIQHDTESMSLQFQADIDFEQFESFADVFIQAIDSRLIEKHWGADRHQWLINFEGCYISFNYEFYGDYCWLSVEQTSDVETLRFLSGLIQNGIVEPLTEISQTDVENANER
ncbi:MAG: DUF3630 family protein [Shewanella sp.]|nr:DUF3630 family protein [Shewanella sp.]